MALSRRKFILGTIGSSAILPFGGHAAQQNSNKPQKVFTNATIITNDAERRTLINQAMVVEEDLIVAIGKTEDILAMYPLAEDHDCYRKALLPGLINCHSHLTATIAKGFNEDFGFPNSYGLKQSPESMLSTDEATVMATLAAVEGLRAGTTTMVQNTSGIKRDAAELIKTGQRWVFAESVRDITTENGPMSLDRLRNSRTPVFSEKLREEGMQRIVELYDSWHGYDGGRISVFPAAALTELSSPRLLRDIRDFADQNGLGYTIHMTQSQAEVQFMIRHHGVRPAIYLAQHDFLGPRLFAAHARYCDEAEIRALGSSQSIITHQAAMAANRGVNPPITRLREAGCRIALGTDNNNTDMLHVMKTAIALERIQRNDEIPGILPQPEDILADACTGGAHAVNQASKIGSLEIGKKADILVLDAFAPHLTPSGRILSAWIHNGQPSDIESILVDGNFVMRDRKLTMLDEENLLEEAYAIGNKLWERLLQNGPLNLPRL